MGEKGLACLDGFNHYPIFGKEALRCDVLTKDDFDNKFVFCSVKESKGSKESKERNLRKGI